MQFEKKNFFQSMLTWLILTHFKKYVQGLVEAVRPSVNIDTSFNLVFLNKSIKKELLRMLAFLNTNFAMKSLVDEII